MSNEDLIIINDKNMEYWINQDFVSEDLKNELKNADVLIIPDFRGKNNDPGFYEKSLYFHDFIRDCNENIDIKFCIDEDLFSTFRLQSSVICMGQFIVKDVIVPLFLGILGNYLYNKIFHESDDEIDIQISIQKENTTKTLKYHGNYEKFQKMIENSSDFIKLFDEKND